MNGFLLVGSGQAEHAVKEKLLHLAAEIKRQSESVIVEVAWLQQQPAVANHVLACVKQGVTRLHVIPWQLSESALDDAERAVRREAEDYRGMTMRFISHDGELSKLLEIVQSCLSDAMKEEESG